MKAATDRRDIALTIITVNYHSALLIQELAISLKDELTNDIEWIVIDNSCDRNEFALLKKIKIAKVIDAGNNLGFGRANNFAARLAKGKYLFFLNPDTLLEKMFLENTKNLLKSKHYPVVAPKVLNFDRTLQKSIHRRFPGLYYHAWEYCPFITIFFEKIAPKYHPSLFTSDEHAMVQHPAHVLGAAFIIKKTIFDDLAGFDEEFFLYREETDLCFRVQDAGVDIIYEPNLVVRHIAGGSGGNKVLAQLDDRYVRSSYLYLRKHASNLVVLAWLVAVLGLAVSSLGFLILMFVTFGKKPSYRIAFSKTMQCLKNHLAHPLAFGW